MRSEAWLEKTHGLKNKGRAAKAGAVGGSDHGQCARAEVPRIVERHGRHRRNDPHRADVHWQPDGILTRADPRDFARSPRVIGRFVVTARGRRQALPH